MLGKLTKAAAYVKSPKKTFALLHPIRAVKYGAAFWLLKRVFRGSRGKEESRIAR